MVAENKKAGAAGDNGNVFEEIPHPRLTRTGALQ
jgi:hypothetical protein